jgi:hypothetical protein
MPRSKVDEAKWNRAKQIVERQHGTAKDKWALIQHIYQKMIGKSDNTEPDLVKTASLELATWADRVLEKGAVEELLVDACVREEVRGSYHGMYGRDTPKDYSDPKVFDACAQKLHDRIVLRMVGYNDDKSPKAKALKALVTRGGAPALLAKVKAEMRAYMAEYKPPAAAEPGATEAEVGAPYGPASTV